MLKQALCLSYFELHIHVVLNYYKLTFNMKTIYVSKTWMNSYKSDTYNEQILKYKVIK